MDKIYMLMKQFGLSLDEATKVAARESAPAVIPKQIPVTDMPVASHTVMNQPDYEPAQWQLVRATIEPNGAREQWERPIPEGTSEVKIMTRPRDVSRRAYLDDNGKWREPPGPIVVRSR